MQLTLTTERGAALKNSDLKIIASAIQNYAPFKGSLSAYITWIAMPKMRLLNRTWRSKDKPTNVLSFPQFEPDELPKAIKQLSKHASLNIGDIVLCLPYIKAEAKEEKKPLNDHLTHLVVHGVLHLLGYDHISLRQYGDMKKLEVAILADLGVPDPYAKPARKKKS
jgi:rRNA maturation RNase YbeY